MIWILVKVFFIPLKAGMTTDKLMDNVHAQIDQYREQTSTVEKDADGDDIWEMVIKRTKKCTRDGVIQLDGAGKPITDATQLNRPKLVYSSSFIARPVVKGQQLAEGREAESDGVLVVRVL